MSSRKSDRGRPAEFRPRVPNDPGYAGHHVDVDSPPACRLCGVRMSEVAERDEVDGLTGHVACVAEYRKELAS